MEYQPFYTLSNGVKIPSIGFGTWQAEADKARSSVAEALRAGYRHIDTAQAYGNEKDVGEGIRESGVPRSEIFITTKLTNDNHTYDLTMSSFEQSLKDLELEYVDMFLIHWPNPIQFRDCWQERNKETWKAMEELYKAGRIRAIGVSNFRKHHIDALLESAEIMPMVNQIRLCPGCTQDELVSYCRSRGMLLEGYSPLGSGKIFDVPEVQEMACAYGMSIAQLCIRWSLQMGFLPLPKSVTPDRIRDNLLVSDLELTEADVSFLTGLSGCAGDAPDPDQMPF